MFNSIISCPVSAESMTLTGFVCKATLIVLDFVPVLISLALLYFLWGGAQWIFNLGNEEKRKEGRTRVIWGLVALFFIMSIGGVIAILMNTFFSGGTGTGGTRSYYSSGYFSGGIQAVQAPINAKFQGNGAPSVGFFQNVWCKIGFGSCPSGGSATIHTGSGDTSSGGNGGIQSILQLNR